MKNIKGAFYLLFTLCSMFSLAQTQSLDYLNINSGNGKGIRFWNGSSHYRIMMGNGTEYNFGPVSDYSIKTTMYRSSTVTNRGWTWGVNGQTPVAAIRTDGTMQINNDFTALGAINSNSYRPLTGDWELYRNGEHLQIREPEQSNKVWATFKDDKALHLQGTPDLWVNGKVGIGTTSPSAPVHIYSNIPGAFPTLKFSYNHGDGNLDYTISTGGFMSIKYGTVEQVNIGSTGDMWIRNGLTTTVVSANKLQVSSGNFKVNNNGYLYARQIEVQATGNFPDYVFDADYDLRSLQEVEAFIDANHHLPDVPSAKEIEENGHNLGQMDEVLLKKVEELTLYLIELKAENKSLNERIKELESKIR